MTGLIDQSFHGNPCNLCAGSLAVQRFRQAIKIFFPAFRQPPSFDFLVLFSVIALLLLRRSLHLGIWNKGCFDDLPATRLKSLRAEIGRKQLKEFLNYPRLAQSLSEEAEGCHIRNTVLYAKPNKLLKGASVIHLEFEFVNRKRKAAPTLRLKNCWRTSILKRIR